MEGARKTVMIGLTGLNADFVYQGKNDLTNLKGLMEKGTYGSIESTVPPDRPQGWSCVLCGKNPGHFGYWDFSYRDRYGYGHPNRVSSRLRDERVDSLYKILSNHGKRVAIINVPVTHPPPEIPNGYSISCLMGTGLEEEFTYPSSLKEEIKKIIGEYIVDGSTGGLSFPRIDREEAIRRICNIDRQRFDLTKYFLDDKNCDFVLTVVTGIERMARLFYQFMEEKPNEYMDDQKYSDALMDHYRFLDERVGEILDSINEGTSIIVLSDYSVQKLEGTVYLNEWLIQEGYMKLKTRPDQLTPLIEADIDWNETSAWSMGSTGQIYINVRGRESQGIVDFHDYDKVLNELSERIRSLTDQQGQKLNPRVYKRKDIHSGEYARFGPDLFVSSEDGHWNMSELIGSDFVYSHDPSKNDTGHGPYGFFVMSGLGVPRGGDLPRASLLDIAPTVLRLMDVPIPPDMEGRVLTERGSADLEEKQRKARERLAKLGYLG